MSARIQKLLAQQGLASRRQIEQWIITGRITVNGQLATLGMIAALTDEFCLDNKIININTPTTTARMLIYNKPTGEICTRFDPEGRPTVFAVLPKLTQSRWLIIGRLDYNTSGLLLFTNDGDVAHRLAHPSFGWEREYRVRVYGKLTASTINKLLRGVELEDGYAAFKKITPLTTVGRNQWLQVVLTEGRNRIVRRLFASQGLIVNRLERIRFGDISLPVDLHLGDYKELNGHAMLLQK